MQKIRVIQQLLNNGVIAVLRGPNANEVIQMADYAARGGIKVIEITMTTPDSLDAIKELSNKFDSDDVLIGAGTVLDPETARLAILNGASFVVSPSLNIETVTLCNRYRVPIMPGVMSIQEIQQALEFGVDIVKLFPGSLFKPSFIKAIKGPLPYVNVMPTGGVSLQNIQTWFENGACAVGIGSDLTASGDFNLITEKASQYVKAYEDYRINAKSVEKV